MLIIGQNITSTYHRIFILLSNVTTQFSNLFYNRHYTMIKSKKNLLYLKPNVVLIVYRSKMIKVYNVPNRLFDATFGTTNTITRLFLGPLYSFLRFLPLCVIYPSFCYPCLSFFSTQVHII